MPLEMLKFVRRAAIKEVVGEKNVKASWKVEMRERAISARKGVDAQAYITIRREIFRTAAVSHAELSRESIGEWSEQG